MPPVTIATAGTVPYHSTLAYVTTEITSHQGSSAKLTPELSEGVRYPICHRRYTAGKTSTTAAASTPRRPLTTKRFRRKALQRLWKPTERVIPGKKMAKKASTAPRVVEDLE